MVPSFTDCVALEVNAPGPSVTGREWRFMDALVLSEGRERPEPPASHGLLAVLQRQKTDPRLLAHRELEHRVNLSLETVLVRDGGHFAEVAIRALDDLQRDRLLRQHVDARAAVRAEDPPRRLVGRHLEPGVGFLD